MKVMHYVGIAFGAAVLAAVVVGLDGMAGLDLFNSAGWGVPQARAQNSPPKPPAAPAPSATQRTERTVYDSWAVTCSESVEKGAKKSCSAMLRMIEEKQREVVLVWVIARDNQGMLRTIIQIPTGIQLAKGLDLKFGNGPSRALPYTACTPKACEASMSMDDAMIHDAKASPEATATIVAIDGKSINLKIGIKGIDKVFLALGK